MYENFEHVGICSIVVLGSFECEDMGSRDRKSVV